MKLLLLSLELSNLDSLQVILIIHKCNLISFHQLNTFGKWENLWKLPVSYQSSINVIKYFYFLLNLEGTLKSLIIYWQSCYYWGNLSISLLLYRKQEFSSSTSRGNTLILHLWINVLAYMYIVSVLYILLLSKTMCIFEISKICKKIMFIREYYFNERLTRLRENLETNMKNDQRSRRAQNVKKISSLVKRECLELFLFSQLGLHVSKFERKWSQHNCES